VTDGPANPVYLDYSATTPVDARVLDAMLPFLSERFGNPNSLYELGRDASRALEDARASFAESIGAEEPGEIVFTGSGTEADDAALLGIAQAARQERRRVVVASFEHHAVLEPARRLGSLGFEVVMVAPDRTGTITPQALSDAVTGETALVSVMHANNEIGAVQPLADLAAVAHERGAFFHSDAAQSLGKIPVDVRDIGIDAMSFSSHKIYGPKGVGALYLRAGTPFTPLIVGGGQERGRRSGTQNVAGAVAIARALEIMEEERPAEMERLAGLRDAFERGLADAVGDAVFVAAEAERLPHVSCFMIPGCEAGLVVLRLDAAGIAVGSGSACSSGATDPSHVLLALGIPRELAFGAVRVSFGRFSTADDVAATLAALPGIVAEVRGGGAARAEGSRARPSSAADGA
jgi:cysteine desulfurase